VRLHELDPIDGVRIDGRVGQRSDNR